MQGHAYNELLPRGEPGFPMELYHLAPGHIRYVMPYHWHMEYELVRILSGRFSIWLNGAPYELIPGDLLWVGGGVLHTGIPEEGCVYECLVFDLNLLLKACGGWSKHLTDLSEQSLFFKPLFPRGSPGILRQAGELFDAAGQQKRGSRLRAFGALCGLLGTLIEAGWYSSELPENEAQRRNIRLLKRLFAYFEEHYAEPVTLAQLAREAGMSPKYFCRFFRSMTQHTPIDYLNRCRVEHACELLASGRHSVTEAAFACGFNDLSYFIRVFKRFQGVTPKQYSSLNGRSRISDAG